MSENEPIPGGTGEPPREAAGKAPGRAPVADEDAPSAEEIEAATAVAEEACREILRLSGLDVRVLAVPGDPVRVEVQGPDAGRVIGKRGLTLGALQYIVSRIVGRRVPRYVPVKVDVEGYRVRRESSLRALAHRVANDAVHDGRRISLEPMTPEERRIIHMALADDPDVETRSEGEGEGRYVVVLPAGGAARGDGEHGEPGNR